MSDRKVAAGLFGTVSPRVSTGEHRPSREQIESPLTHEDCVAHFFCGGCGQMFEVDAPGLEMHSARLDLSVEQKGFSRTKPIFLLVDVVSVTETVTRLHS